MAQEGEPWGLRVAVRYGDPGRWDGTLLSFLNCQKYPPSLDFLLMTLGPALLLLGLLHKLQFSANNPMIVFGRVPLFYFLVHMFVAHIAAVVAGANQYSLAGVYVAWICIVVGMYPLCRWYVTFEASRRPKLRPA